MTTTTIQVAPNVRRVTGSLAMEDDSAEDVLVLANGDWVYRFDFEALDDLQRLCKGVVRVLRVGQRGYEQFLVDSGEILPEDELSPEDIMVLRNDDWVYRRDFDLLTQREQANKGVLNVLRFGLQSHAEFLENAGKTP